MYVIFQIKSTIPANSDKRNSVVKKFKISYSYVSSGLLNTCYSDYFPAIQSNTTCDFLTSFWLDPALWIFILIEIPQAFPNQVSMLTPGNTD